MKQVLASILDRIKPLFIAIGLVLIGAYFNHFFENRFNSPELISSINREVLIKQGENTGQIQCKYIEEDLNSLSKSTITLENIGDVNLKNEHLKIVFTSKILKEPEIEQKTRDGLRDKDCTNFSPADGDNAVRLNFCVLNKNDPIYFSVYSTDLQLDYDIQSTIPGVTSINKTDLQKTMLQQEKNSSVMIVVLFTGMGIFILALCIKDMLTFNRLLMNSKTLELNLLEEITFKKFRETVQASLPYLREVEKRRVIETLYCFLIDPENRSQNETTDSLIAKFATNRIKPLKPIAFGSIIFIMGFLWVLVWYT